ncbi:hypothetical protein H0266_05715 [Halobacillus locisalis]|uniref:Lipoprotein n=1 Tax=Halobacillus locisalis TaxID=220753 RepID=A0A838CR27_9BACI|nr:hypothetical protein [Halobacillus locisalis]MBA2174401.1 hypothetical protein [Halobacillus locisalis]
MKKWCTILGILIFTLAGCQSSHKTAQSANLEGVQTESTQNNSERQPSESALEHEVIINEKVYSFRLDDYPILSKYVHNFHDPLKKFQSLTFKPIHEDLYVVTFACHQNKCSTLLLDLKKGASFLLSDLSALVDQQLSIDEAFASFLFERKRENGTNIHQLLVIDLQTMQPVSLELDNDDNLIPRPNQYQYEIQSVTFKNNQLLIVSSDPSSITKNTWLETTWTYK